MHAEILLEAGRQRTSRKSCENLTEDHSPGRFVSTAGPAALRGLDPAHDRFGVPSRLHASLEPSPLYPSKRTCASCSTRSLSTKAQNRCAIARCAGSPTASAVIGGEIVNS